MASAWDELKAGLKGITKVPSMATEVSKEAVSRVAGGNSYDMKNPFNSSYGKTPNNSAVVGKPTKPPGATPQKAATSESPETKVPGSTPTSSGPSAADQGTAAFYGNQIGRLNQLLGSLDTTREQGLGRIGDEFNLATGRANEDQSRVLRDIGVQREDTEKDKVKNLGEIDTSVRNTSEGLQRQFRLGGAGISGASQIFAPNAVSKMGSERRGTVLDRFGRNLRNLDTTEGDANQQHERTLSDLTRQRKSQETSFTGGVEEQRLSIIDRLADAAYNQQAALGGNADAVRSAIDPYTQQVNSIIARLGQIAEEGRQPVYNVAPINVETPELEGYTTDPLKQSLQRSGGTQGYDEEYTPYLPLLKRLESYAV